MKKLINRISRKIQSLGGLSQTFITIVSLIRQQGLSTFMRMLVSAEWLSTQGEDVDGASPFELREPAAQSDSRVTTVGGSLELDPIISVVIPCYNQAEYLESALLSVASATTLPHQCIVIDDGNTSRSQLMTIGNLKALAPHQELILVSQRNGGLANARNAGLAIARGKYIKFLDADDLLEPNSIDRSIEKMSELSAEVLISNYSYWNESTGLFKLNQPSTSSNWVPRVNKVNKLTQEILFEGWESEISIPIHSALFSNSGIPKFDESLKTKEDFDFWLRYFKLPRAVAYLAEVTCIYRGHRQQMTASRMLHNGAYLLQVIFKASQESERFSNQAIANKIQYVETFYGSDVFAYWVKKSSSRAKWLSEFEIGGVHYE